MGVNLVAFMHLSGGVATKLNAKSHFYDFDVPFSDQIISTMSATGYAESLQDDSQWIDGSGNRMASETEDALLSNVLSLRSGFSMTFGKDTLSLSHIARLAFLQSEGDLARLVLASLDSTCSFLGGNQYLISNDACSLLDYDLQIGSFEELLLAARGLTQVSSISDLYAEFDDMQNDLNEQCIIRRIIPNCDCIISTA